MKCRPSSFLVAVLLTGFVAGGAIAPALHYVQHAQEHQAAQKERSCEHGAHEVPMAEDGSTHDALDQCWLCTRHLSEGPSLVWEGAVLRHEAVRSAVVLARRALDLESGSIIRGPPERA